MVIKASNITRIYKMGSISVKVLNHISLSVEKGKFISIMGPSGAGKSTFLHILGCLDRPTSGEYKLDGLDVVNMNDSQLSNYRNKKIGFIFQLFNLLPKEDIFYNVELPLFYAKKKKKERKERVEEVLSLVGLLHRITHKPNQLSGGECQRVAIARALVNCPALLLADEPTGNLDSHAGHQIMEIFTQLNEQGHTIILVTHNEEMAKYAKYSLYLRDGKIEK